MNEQVWTEQPPTPGSYWMNYFQFDAFVTAIVEIRKPPAKTTEPRAYSDGLWMNELHFWRKQFPQAMYQRLVRPTPPLRTPKDAKVHAG